MYTIISAEQRILAAITRIPTDDFDQIDIQNLGSLVSKQGAAEDVQTYQCSAFNYHVSKGEDHLLYNTLYHSLIRINTAEYNEYLNLRVTDEEFGKELTENGFWVADHVNERDRYLQLAGLYTRNCHRPLNVTVTTTLRCNARCSYCYEAGVPKRDFSPDQTEALLAFISSHDTSHGVNINWFGGEPLMNTALIDKVSEYLTVREISFSSYLITNGSLLTDQIIKEKLKPWHIGDMQITIDGRQEEYLRRKSYVRTQDGDFFQLLYRISQVAQAGVYTHIRLNIDRENTAEIFAVIQELESLLGRYERVVFYPAFLSGVENPLRDEEKEEIIYRLLTLLRNPQKLTGGTKFYSLPRAHACMREDPRSFSIDVDGNVYNCEHLVGKPQQAIGCLQKGLYAGVDARLFQPVLQDKCFQCVFLPKCMGGCQAHRAKSDSPCMIERYLLPAYLRFLLD